MDHHSQPDRTNRTTGKTLHPIPNYLTFSISTLMLTTFLVSLFLAFMRFEPAVAGIAVFFSIPAFFRTVWGVWREYEKGLNVSSFDKVLIFIQSLGVSSAILLLSIATFCAVFFVASLLSAQIDLFMDLGGNLVLVGIMASVALGLTSGLIVGGYTAHQLWPVDNLTLTNRQASKASS